MEPRIQYAKTSDGVNIAYWTMGKGPPLVLPGWRATPLRMPASRGWFEALAQSRVLVGYERRGSGMSDRDVNDYSLGAMVLDLEAVVESLGLEKFALFGSIHFGPVAIVYATRYPERVTQLILWCTYASGADFWRSPRAQAFRALRQTDWELYTESIADLNLGLEVSREERRAWAASFREEATPQALQLWFDANEGFDVTELLPQVQSPTLVMHRRGLRQLSVDVARSLASGIPGARLAVVDGEAIAPFADNGEVVLRAVAEFLGGGEEQAAAPPDLPSGTAVILFADIADSTALTERLGDAGFRAKARELDGALRAIIRERAGTAIEGKLLGHGVLAVFTSARQAIEAALACEAAGSHTGLPLHLGLHAGDVIREENNVYGGAVNIASRIAGLSAPGEVLVSETVRSLARTSAGVRFEDRGEQSLKGVGEAVRVWAVVAARNQQTGKPANPGE